MTAALSIGPVLLLLSGWPYATPATRARRDTDSVLSEEEGVDDTTRSDISNTLLLAAKNIDKLEEQAEIARGRIAAARGRLRELEDREKADRRQRLERHRLENIRDCNFTEEWGEWGDCSATCGGGVMTQQLKSRTITQRQDRFGYGKPCSPRQCTARDRSGCGERNFEPCATDLCEADCSVVDLGNRLPAPGAAARWTYQKASPEGQCVFQLWQVLAGNASTSPRLRLLGETAPQVGDASDATVLDTNSRGGEKPLVLREGGGIDHRSVALGFRGCELAAAKGPGSPATARVCLNAREGFRQDNQVVRIDGKSRVVLRRYRADSRRAPSLKELTDTAGREEGVGQGDARVTVPVALPAGPARAAFELQVAMRERPPEAPSWQPFVEEGDAIRLRVSSAGGGKLHLAVRKVFGKISARNRGYCQFIELPECRGGGELPFPSTDPSSGDAAFGAACVDDGLLLRNLPFASNYEVKIWEESAAGTSGETIATVPVRGRPGVKASECQVHYWSCAAGDGEEYSEALPEEGSPECELEGPSIPACQMAPRRDAWGYETCTGKRYWRACRPHMWNGNASCVGGEAQAACVHGGTAKSDKQGTSATTCKQPGCPSSIFATAHCCCKPSSADGGEDSPNCACTRKSCAELGLVAAADGMRSCRH